MRPKRHYTPHKNWMNDPNGLVQFNGIYHMYYQYNPYNDQWGNMSWGHAVSKDLLNWEEKDIALIPDMYEDEDGCFSGSALPVGDHILYAYTGVRFLEYRRDSYGNKVPVSSSKVVPYQIFATSDDGDTIRKQASSIMEVPGDIVESEFRDPYIFGDGHQIMMFIGGQKNQTGGYILYHLEIDHWVRMGEDFGQIYGEMLECPSYVDMGDQSFLMYSAMGSGLQKRRDIAVYGPVGEKMSIGVKEVRQVDLNDTIYACQCFRDEADEWYMIGWLRMDTPVMNHSWTGMMSIPRKLNHRHKQLIQTPVTGDIVWKDMSLEHIYKFEEIEAYSFKVATDHRKLSIEIFISPHTYWLVEFSEGYARIKAVVEGRSSEIKSIKAGRSFQIIKDSHVVEMFFDGGAEVYTEIYHDEVDIWQIGMNGDPCRVLFGIM